MPRLFTAIEIPPSVAEALDMLRGGVPGARWIDRENYHLTLRFIGDVDDVAAREAADALAQIKRMSFDLHFDGLAAFGGRKPRAVVANVAPTPALLELQAEQERLMRRVGLPPEPRKYTPHVTLARLRTSSSLDGRTIYRRGAFFAPRRFPSRGLRCFPRAPRPAADLTWRKRPIR
jgi:2'-5' RNA ligase